ncbi:MAG TPA: GNAT family protein [Candidatus Limnocylindrales bacterium]|nr:GNAT family protein [Candidatus Limnocylindrales bacterium]
MNDQLINAAWRRPTARPFPGRYIDLLPLNAERDCHELFEAGHRTSQHEAVWQFLWQGPFADAAAMRAWLERGEKGTDTIFFSVEHQQRKVGMISIMSIVPEMGRAELGHIWYAPEVQRTKVNTEAVFLLLDYLLSELRYRRVEWKCDARNERSRNAALRLGFAFEGIFRQHMIVKGKNRDTAWFSLLDAEWGSIRANMHRWLYENDSVSLGKMNKEK